MKLRRQRLDLRRFLGTEIPLGELSLDLRQRVRHGLAGHGDLSSLSAAVVRELLERGLLRRAGVVREGSERITVYSLPHSPHVYDLRPLLGDTAGDGLLFVGPPEPPGPPVGPTEADAPAPAPAEPVGAESTSRPESGTDAVAVVPAPSTETARDETPAGARSNSLTTARLVPIDAIRRTLDRDWVSFGLETSLEGLLDELGKILGGVDLLLWIWGDRLGASLEERSRWRVLESDSGQGMALRRQLEASGGDPVHVEGRRWLGLKMDGDLVAALGTNAEVDDRQLRTTIGAIEALLLAHRRSQQRVYSDPLTGLNNRGFFETQLVVELERSRRTGQSLALLFVDIDHFKRVNDTLGHDVGDLVLRHVARLLVEHLRRIDQVFRWGGEEFALLLPGTGEGEALHTAERLRSVVERSPLWLDDGRDVRCTVSIGIAMAPRHAEGGERAFLRHADQALYAAKSGGRNQVLVYAPSMD